MSTYTPGPYQRDGRFVYKMVDSPNPRRGGPGQENLWLANVTPCGIAVDTAELEAVATLFQAAPDLYAALVQCRKEIADFKRLAHGKAPYPHTKGMEMADAALLKAEGGRGMSHTKEPWSNGLVVIDGEPVTAVLDCNGNEICNMGNTLLDEDAHARRIVACVNACRHLTTEQLEDDDRAILGKMARVFVESQEREKRTSAELAKVKEERDEAVEALRRWQVLFLDSDMRPEDECHECYDFADAVLAKIEGRKS